ncbi:MAG: RluA family pseudouridine synthase [Sulfobacillus thermotolerans]|nr:RluA family pseudouridine synthase [Sulfobacillus thermotolerans]
MESLETGQRVEAHEAGQRLDRLLMIWNPRHSRTFWQRQIKDGRVAVNGQKAKASYVVEAGDWVQIEALSAEPAPVPWNAARAVDETGVIYRDDAIIVLNKPKGLVVHPSHGHEDDSVVHRLAPLLGTGGEDFRPGVVHRLDRDTTGLMVLARTEEIRSRLSAMIQERVVHRDYIAVITGTLPEPAGVIDAPIGRDPANRLRMAVVYGGRVARTHYRTLAAWDKVSLVQLRLETGRTHQIRVHLASVGHPVVGDPLYSRAKGTFTSQLLHAVRLSFPHPVSGQPLCFTQMPPSEEWTRWSTTAGPITIIDPVALPHTALCAPEMHTVTLLQEGLGILGEWGAFPE